MKTKIFFNSLSSKKLNETFAKQFGGSVDIDNYSREQLEDIRNKLRTRVFQQESSSGYNELLTKETYQKDKAMLQLLNTRIKEMLDENLKMLKDTLKQIDEGKKDRRAHKHPRSAKGTTGGDITGDGKKNFDDVQAARRIAGGQDRASAVKAATSDKFKEEFGDIKKPQPSGGSGIKRGKYGSSYDAGDEPQLPTEYEPRKFRSSDSDPELDIVSTEPGKYGDPFSTRMSAMRKVQKGASSGRKVSPETQLDMRMARQYLELISDGEPVTDDEIQDVVDTMTASDDYRARVMKRVKGASSTMESAKKCNHTAEGKMCPVHGMKECGTMEATERKAKVKPSKGMTAKEKSASVKQAKAGKDMGEPGKTFKDIEQAAGGGEKGKKIAGAAFWKGQAKKAKAKESINAFRANVRLVNESLERMIAEDEEGKAKAITAASDIVNDYTSWMQRVGQYQTKALIELGDAIRADFGLQQAETFKSAVAPALEQTLSVLMQQREAISNAVASLAGEEVTPTETMGAEPEVIATGPDMMNQADQFAASEPAAGGAEASGREMRESRFQRKIAESHSIISKLAK